MLLKFPESDVTPLCFTNETQGWENRPFTTIWPEKQQNEKFKIEKTIKKKPKRARTAFSTDQLRALEQCFLKHKYIDTERRRQLAKTLNIGEKCVKIWFQNRRMKNKRESSESSSECSSETIGDAVPSPPPEPLGKSSHCVYYDPYYQPYFYPYASHNVNEPRATISTSISGHMPFYNDGTIYPTQYYPSVEPNVEQQSYWPGDNNDLCYF